MPIRGDQAAKLRLLALLLGTPQAGSLELLAGMAGDAPWLEQSLGELTNIALDEWQGEHMRLFVTGYPHTACPPFESHWRHGLTGGACVSELEALYSKLGLETDGAPADYLGVMLDCAAHCIEAGSPEAMDALRELSQEHFALWLEDFTRALEENAQLQIYRELAREIANERFMGHLPS